MGTIQEEVECRECRGVGIVDSGIPAVGREMCMPCGGLDRLATTTDGGAE
jgi:hypothetical protein